MTHSYHSLVSESGNTRHEIYLAWLLSSHVSAELIRRYPLADPKAYWGCPWSAAAATTNPTLVCNSDHRRCHCPRSPKVNFAPIWRYICRCKYCWSCITLRPADFLLLLMFLRINASRSSATCEMEATCHATSSLT